MRTERIIFILCIVIIVLSALSAVTGVISNEEYNYDDIKSVYGETVELYNVGLYAKDSVSAASQAIAQDYVTLILGIPLLILSLILAYKKNLKGWFLMTGTLGYFLYTYMSYSFLMFFNNYYLLNLLLAVLSFYAFVLSIVYLNKFDYEEIFSSKYPVKSISIYLFFVGFALLLMWMGRIVPAMISGEAPYGLEHYSTLVIQSLDLGFIVPISFVTAYLILKKYKIGYILSTVLVMKMLTMGAAVSAMAFNMKLHNVEMSIGDLIIFPVITLINAYFLYSILRSINKSDLNKKHQ